MQLKELLALKQQQASIFEARLALKRSDESIQQGQAVMAFTIMTIIFVSTLHPLRSSMIEYWDLLYMTIPSYHSASSPPSLE